MHDPSQQPTHERDLARVNADAAQLLTRVLEKPKILPRVPVENPHER